MLDAERSHAMTGDRAKPGQCRRMPVEHADDTAMRWHVGEQALNVRTRVHEPALAGALCGSPAGIKAIGGRDRQQADIATVFRHQTDGFDCFRSNCSGVRDDDLAIWAGLAVPISAVDDLLLQLRRHLPLDLLDWPC